MKANYLFLIVIMFFASCEKPSDCFESAGKMSSKEVAVTPFSKVIIHNGIAAIITQGAEYSVNIDSPENLISDIEVQIVDGLLKIKDNTTCNFTRKYGLTTVHITAPNLTEIHSKTEKNIISNGVLNFPDLKLFSMDVQDGAGTGDFILEVVSDNLAINFNNVSAFFISGSCNLLYLNVYEGNGIVRAENLVAQNINLYQRGSNDLHLKAKNSLVGKILSTGNVFCYGVPGVVDVEQPYIGKLIFK